MSTVQYRSLGKSGIKVSPNCEFDASLGAMSFGSPKWAPWVLDEQPSIYTVFFLPHSRLSSWFRTAGTACIGNNLNVSTPALSITRMKDKQALFVARPRPESDKARDRHQQHKPSHGQFGRMSQNQPPAATPTSAMPPTPGKQSRPISFWAHIILFICCASLSRANANDP
ncbi:hypothetical protein C8R48DRAFT_773702 [Suillus tomentosus]|nr:hypothetical protein C8R48DRAFT_773702 [Suillus tomentosus]